MRGLPWQAAMAVRVCYRDSKLQSTVRSGMVTLHRAVGTWQNKVNCQQLMYICQDVISEVIGKAAR